MGKDIVKSAGRQTEVGQWEFRQGQRENMNQGLPAASGGNGGFRAVFQERGMKIDSWIHPSTSQGSWGCWRGASARAEAAAAQSAGGVILSWTLGGEYGTREWLGWLGGGCAWQGPRATGQRRCDKRILLHSWSCTCLPQCSSRACS